MEAEGEWRWVEGWEERKAWNRTVTWETGCNEMGKRKERGTAGKNVVRVVMGGGMGGKEREGIRLLHGKRDIIRGGKKGKKEGEEQRMATCGEMAGEEKK